MSEALLQQMHEAFGEFKKANDAQLAEIKKYGEASGEIKSRVEKLNGTIDGLEKKINDKLTEVETAAKAREAAWEKRLDEIEARSGKKSGPAKEEDKLSDPAFRKSVFFKALRTNITNPAAAKSSGFFDEMETKVLALSNDQQAGFLAPPEYVADILKDVVQFSPIRQYANVRTTTASSVLIPKRTRTAAATWVSETGTRAETQNPQYGLENIQAHEMWGKVLVSKQELEDSAFDIEALIRAELAEQFGVTEGTAFCTGANPGQPEGILTNSRLGIVVSGSAANITADGIIATFYELKEEYLNNATWMLSRSTLKAVRQLKDGTGQYLWAPGIQVAGRPATILDRPYATCPDYPSIGANNYPITFGDVKRAYTIVDRIAIDFLVDPYTSKNVGMIEISARRRVGGQIVIADAIKKNKCST